MRAELERSGRADAIRARIIEEAEAARVAVGAHIVELAEARAQRRAAHATRLERTARQLGRAVAAHELTVADAETRLAALATRRDPDCPAGLPLVPWREAEQITAAAFAAGIREGRNS